MFLVPRFEKQPARAGKETSMALYIVNALSLNMISSESPEGGIFWVHYNINGKRVTVDGAVATLAAARSPIIPAIGHADTARVVATTLEWAGCNGLPALHARVNVSVRPGDQLLVAQYSGPRLPEGATTLPEGARIEFWLLTIHTY